MLGLRDLRAFAAKTAFLDPLDHPAHLEVQGPEEIGESPDSPDQRDPRAQAACPDRQDQEVKLAREAIQERPVHQVRMTYTLVTCIVINIIPVDMHL